MAKDPVKLFECACIIVSVGYTLIGNNGEINVFVFFNAAVFLNFKSGSFCTESDEYRAGSEVIKMMINRGNSEGTKVCDEHAAMERGGFVDDFGHDSVIIGDFKERDEKADEERRHDVN